MTGITIASYVDGTFTGGSVTITKGSTVAVVVSQQTTGTFSGAGSCTDTAGNPYTSAATYSNQSYTIQADVFYSLNVASSATSITYTPPSGGSTAAGRIGIWVLTPINGSITVGSAAIQQYLGNTTTSTNGITTASLSVSTSGGLIVGLVGDISGADPVTGSGFTSDGIANSEHQYVSSSTPVAFTGTVANKIATVAGISFNFSPTLYPPANRTFSVRNGLDVANTIVLSNTSGVINLSNVNLITGYHGGTQQDNSIAEGVSYAALQRFLISMGTSIF